MTLIGTTLCQSDGLQLRPSLIRPKNPRKLTIGVHRYGWNGACIEEGAAIRERWAY
jgi:hypothetical protein